LPASFSALTRLTSLSLGKNAFKGTIPASFSLLTGLTYLSFYNNTLSGTLPASLSMLTNLITLYVYNNFLSGSVPPSLLKLPKLLPSEFGRFPQICPAPLYRLGYSEQENNFGVCTLTPAPTRAPTQVPTTFPTLSGAADGLVMPMVGGGFWRWNCSLNCTTASTCSVDGSSHALTGGMLNVTNLSCRNRITSLVLRNNSLYGPLSDVLADSFPALDTVDVSHNYFEGAVPQSLLRVATRRFFPQSSICPEFEVRLGYDELKNDFGICALVPEPSFEVKAVSRVLSVQAAKLSAEANSACEALVIASNVNGPGGINGQWHAGGLNASSLVSCSDGPPVPCEAAECSTIWILPDNTCAVLNERHVTNDMVELDAANTTATIFFKMFPRDLPEGKYNFTAFVPARNRKTWSYFTLAAEFEVVAVADPSLSVLSACQKSRTDQRDHCTSVSTERAVFKSVHVQSTAILVKVLAKDINALPISRTGETISLEVAQSTPAGTWMSHLTLSFNSISRLYEVAIPEVTVECNYTIVLRTLLQTSNPQSLRIAIECDNGYVAETVTGACKPSNRCDSDDQYMDAETLQCKRKPAMAVSGSSTTVLVHVLKTNVTKTAFGTAEVRLSSGDVDPSAPVQWTASLPANTPWLSCDHLSGKVDGQSPANWIQVAVDASGLNDTRGSTFPPAVIAVTSLLTTNGSAAFAQGSDKLSLNVSVSVRAIAYLSEGDLRISLKGHVEPVSLSRIPSGASLIVTVVPRDCDRLIIDRPDQRLELIFSSSLGTYAPRATPLLYATGGAAGVFEAELPGTWLGEPGMYTLAVHTESGSVVSRSFEVVDLNGATIIQGAVVGSLCACVIIGMLVMVYRNPGRAKQLFLSFLNREFKLILSTISEIWDIVGALHLSA
jgi:hypothetical protein